ncbi:MAG: alpha-amylase family glycosyl hydrolase [Ferruginibacter sp.]
MSKPTIPTFLSNSNIYEVNLRQYSPEGTIRAFMEHLPRLHDMGVEILWMMPIHPIGIVKRKGTLGSYYSIKDYCDVNPEFGTRQDFKALVEAVHKNGMKIIIDWVANHTAWDNVWTITNPEFFVHAEDGNFKPPFDWDDVLQIDHSSEGEQAAMLDAMKYWITEFDIDGFRADLAHLTPLPFWVNARSVLGKLKNELIWLAETEDVNYFEAFDISYAWKWMHATEDFFKNGLNVSSLINLLAQQKASFPPGVFELFFTTNHDENSWNGTEYEKYGIYAKALAVFSFTYPYSVPLIYSGQELPNLKRLKFFDKDIIEWSDQPALHSFYKTLTAFHKRMFAGGELVIFHADKNVLGYSYSKNDKTILTFLNLDKEKVSVNFISEKCKGNFKNVFSNQEMYIDDVIKLEMEPGEYLLLEKY